MLDRIKQAIRILFKRKEIVNLTVTYSSPNARFEGKKVVVTGGTSGIGLAIDRPYMCSQTGWFGQDSGIIEEPEFESDAA